MFAIALIGAGNLGRRHLEGLLRLPYDLSLFIIDPSEEPLNQTRLLIDASERANQTRARYSTTIAEPDEWLDYVVVATSADVRFDVIRDLLRDCAVSSMLLEKVLFQRKSDYASAANLLQQQSVAVWVNTARRAMDIHQQIKKFFVGDVIRYFDVRGGEWGLGCNGIHFLDLLSYLTGSWQLSVSTRDLDQSLLPSKRLGFSEFTGTLRGTLGPAEFDLCARRGSSAGLLTTIRSDNRTCILDEAAGRAFFNDRAISPAWSELQFVLPYISQLSTEIAKSILTTGRCSLPSFGESASLHVPFVDALATFNGQYCGGDYDIAPVT